MEFFHKMLSYAFLTIRAQFTRKFDAAVYVFLFTVSYNERNNFAKTSLREALHQINFILWFFELKTCKDNSNVNKSKF